MRFRVRCLLKEIYERAYYAQEHCKAILLASTIAFAPIKYAFSELLAANTSLHLEKGLSSIPLWGILGILFIWPFIRRLKLTKDEIFLFLFLLLGFFPFMLNHPEELNEWIKILYESLIIAFPCYIVAQSMKNYDLFEKLYFRQVIL